MTYASVHQLVGRIRARTGVEFTPHMLRHTHATELIRSGGTNLFVTTVASLIKSSYDRRRVEVKVRIDD